MLHWLEDSKRPSRVRHPGLFRSLSGNLFLVKNHSPFRIPVQARGENIALDANLSAQAADQMGATGLNWNDFGNGLTVFRDDEAFAAQMADQVQALLLE